MRIGQREIGQSAKPFIIAEMSGNHNQSLDRALAIVEAAAATGADALKIQTYTPDTMTLDINEGDFRIDDPRSLWAGRSLYDLYREAHMPWEWHKPILARAHELGLIAFSTPFDETSVNFLETLDVPCYKIASFEVTDVTLLKTVGTTGKPVIMSTGMASLSEIEEAVTALRRAGCNDIVLLKCTSTYPATADCSHLRTIPHLRAVFGCEVGLSDHTAGIGVAVASVALGATVIEKHFTLSRADGGVDAEFSLEPDEMARLVTETERAWRGLGDVVFGGTAIEQKSKMFRRSIYASQDIAAGELLTRENTSVIRPGFGLAPKHYGTVLGRVASTPIKRGTALRWDLLSAKSRSQP